MTTEEIVKELINGELVVVQDNQKIAVQKRLNSEINLYLRK